MNNSNWNMCLTDRDNNACSTPAAGTSVAVCFDGNYFEVDAIRDRGHTVQPTTAYIPVDVIVSMLRHAGYAVQTPMGI